MPIRLFSLAVIVDHEYFACGSAIGYSWPHRCFSDMTQSPHSSSCLEIGANQLDDARADVEKESDLDDSGYDYAPFFIRLVWRSLFVGGAWVFSTRARRHRTRQALGLASVRWHSRLVSLIGRTPSAASLSKPTFCGSRQSSEADAAPRRRMTRCATEPSLGPATFLQRRNFDNFMKIESDSESDVESGRGRRMTKRKTEPPMQSKSFTYSEGVDVRFKPWACQPKSNAAQLRSRVKQVPSHMELEEIFDGVAPQESSDITPALLKDVVQVLNQRYAVDFQESDAERLHLMMKARNENRVLTRSDFIETTRSLLRAVKSAKVPLSFAQLRLIMGTAFERFDINADGDLSLEEFSAALLSFDINLPEKQAETLLQFLSQETSGKAVVLNKEDFALEGSSSSEEQVLTAVANAQEKMADFTGWRSAVEIKNKVAAVCSGEGNVGEKMKRLRETLEVEKVADSTELALMIASIAMVLLNNPAHAAVTAPDPSVFELGSQMRYMAEALPSATSILFQSGSMGPMMLSGILAASKAMRKEGAISLGSNEALLYVQSFQHKGCSLSFFHKLIACSEYRWGSAKPGDFLLLNSMEPELKILLHGQGQRKGVKVGAGAVLMKQSEDDKVQIEEPVTYIAWNVRKLTELIKHTKDPALVKLVRDMIQEADPGYADEKVSTRPKNVNGLLAALSEAVQLQAKRKGLSMCYALLEGLQRLVMKSNTSTREKICQCRALLLESADDLMEGLEGLADFAGACSTLAALGTHALGGDGELSPDDVLRLTPLFMLASLTLGKHVNAVVGNAEDTDA